MPSPELRLLILMFDFLNPFFILWVVFQTCFSWKVNKDFSSLVSFCQVFCACFLSQRTFSLPACAGPGDKRLSSEPHTLFYVRVSGVWCWGRGEHRHYFKFISLHLTGILAPQFQGVQLLLFSLSPWYKTNPSVLYFSAPFSVCVWLPALLRRLDWQVLTCLASYWASK